MMPPPLPKLPGEDDTPVIRKDGTIEDMPAQWRARDKRNLESAERLKLQHEAAKRIEDYQIAQQPDSRVLDVESQPRLVRWWQKIAALIVWI